MAAGSSAVAEAALLFLSVVIAPNNTSIALWVLLLVTAALDLPKCSVLFSSTWPLTDINEVDACCYQHIGLLLGRNLSTLDAISDILVENRDFWPVTGSTPRRNITISFGTEKQTRMGLPDGEKKLWDVFARSRFDTIHERDGEKTSTFVFFHNS